MSGFPWHINGDPVNNLESLCIFILNRMLYCMNTGMLLLLKCFTVYIRRAFTYSNSIYALKYNIPPHELKDNGNKKKRTLQLLKASNDNRIFEISVRENCQNS